MTDAELKNFYQALDDDPYAANRTLFGWLSDDKAQVALYDHLQSTHQPFLEFQSRAKVDSVPPTPPVFHQQAFLVTSRGAVEAVLSNPDVYSNIPYAALGSGTFMLGLDAKGKSHSDQWEFAAAALAQLKPHLRTLIGAAYQAASVLPLKRAEFNLAELAQQAAVRFVGFAFGYPASDHPMLEVTMAKAFRGLNYQILGRHFVSEPAAIPEATANMGALLARTAALIDEYRSSGLPEDLRRLYEGMTLEDHAPVLQIMARIKGQFSGNERAVVAVGLIAGIIGNVQSSVCIAVNEFFERGLLQQAEEAARKDAGGAALGRMVMEALRLHPPAAFLPRQTTQSVTIGKVVVPAGAQLILAMGSATRDEGGDDLRLGELPEDDLIFGGVRDKLPHHCIGKHLAQPLVTYIVQQVVTLSGLGRPKDVLTGAPSTLKKTWGFTCEKFLLRYERDRRLIQQPLNVIMKVKMPVSEHAEKLKMVIKYGAPQIESKLNEARHVHFSWFVFLENDTKLALFTTYDGNFEAYIEHFAFQIGPLFDKLFEHIQDAPPLPVEKFPKEFVQTIRRYNETPVEGYFFSAYPTQNVAAINTSADAAAAARRASLERVPS